MIRFANDAAGLLAFEFDSMTLPQPVTTIFTTTTPSSSCISSAADRGAGNRRDRDLNHGGRRHRAASGRGHRGAPQRRRLGRRRDGNLAGRFTTQTFTLPRLSRVQGYYLRQYDGSSPAKYSRDSALLHVDYPL